MQKITFFSTLSPVAPWLLCYASICFLGCTEPGQTTDDSKLTPTKLPKWKQTDLRAAKAKLTFFGDQVKPILAIVFYTSESDTSLDGFSQFQRRAYSNDSLDYRKFKVQSSEFERVLDSTATLDWRPRGADDRFDLSFVVTRRRDDGTYEGVEMLVPSTLEKSFYGHVIDSLDERNDRGRRIIGRQLEQVAP